MEKVPKATRLTKKQDELLDKIAELLVDDFLARRAAGTLPKPLKRAKKSVRK